VGPGAAGRFIRKLLAAMAARRGVPGIGAVLCDLIDLAKRGVGRRFIISDAVYHYAGDDIVVDHYAVDHYISRSLY
jgi:hypothetical protein